MDKIALYSNNQIEEKEILEFIKSDGFIVQNIKEGKYNIMTLTFFISLLLTFIF